MNRHEELEVTAVNDLRLAISEYLKTMEALRGVAVHQSPRVTEYIGVAVLESPDGQTDYRFFSMGATEGMTLRVHEAIGLATLMLNTLQE